VTRVLVAVESAILRKGLETILAASPNLEVVDNEIAGASDWKQRLEESQPDVVVTEGSEDDSTASLAEFVSEDERPLPVVILADHPAAPWVRDALRAGVRAVLPRDATGEEIVAAVEAAAAGFIVLQPSDFDSLLPPAAARPRAASLAPLQSLSPREIEVLRMLAEGLGNKEIAWRLGISEHTVKFHINSIFTKLDASSRTEAVTIGIRQGLILI
jgi:two-component system, NarL family, response regulator YdfI